MQIYQQGSGLIKAIIPRALLLGEVDPGYTHNTRAAPQLTRKLCPQQCICSSADFKEHGELDIVLFLEPAILPFPLQWTRTA